jgi:hypothetical protein
MDLRILELRSFRNAGRMASRETGVKTGRATHFAREVGTARVKGSPGRQQRGRSKTLKAFHIKAQGRELASAPWVRFINQPLCPEGTRSFRSTRLIEPFQGSGGFLHGAPRVRFATLGFEIAPFQGRASKV